MTFSATVKRLALSKYLYALVFVAGAVAFFYPLFSSLYNYQAQTRVINSYQEEVTTYSPGELKVLRDDAESYNRFIAGLEGNVTDKISDQERASSEVSYEKALSASEVMGYVRIPKIEVKLPIYKGTSDVVLDHGVGHMERSSLPIGGLSSHCVLVGHRGLPTSRLFRDLGMLKVGDLFFIGTLDTELTYEVESVQRVLPAEVGSLQVQEGRDLCTLVTCDPYMINSHRLLVTGHRVQNVPEQGQAAAGHITFIQKYGEYFWVVGATMLLWLVVLVVRRRIRRAHEK